jgi:ribosomal protein S18 acetylase RimI-like enzyme
MSEAIITIRMAVSEDADRIACVFLESAEYHARLDPERYSAPGIGMISAGYQARLRLPEASAKSITLVAELNAEIVGFLDARLERSPDPMHREMIYCHIAEIAVSSRCQNRGIGERLLRAAEDWGRRHGAQFASLEYHVANMRARVFYERRMGYRAASITVIKPLC